MFAAAVSYPSVASALRICEFLQGLPMPRMGHPCPRPDAEHAPRDRPVAGAISPSEKASSFGAISRLNHASSRGLKRCVDDPDAILELVKVDCQSRPIPASCFMQMWTSVA